MSALAAIDAAIEGIHGEGYECRGLENARAAIAELIEAAARLERKAIEQSRLTSSVFNSDVQSLRSALACVRGAA